MPESMAGFNGMITIAVVNQKGGVGKTTVTFNLARWLALRGWKVLAVDNDPQANLTLSFLDSRSKRGGSLLDLYSGRPPNPLRISDELFLIGSDLNLATAAEQRIEVVHRLRDCVREMSDARHSSRFDYLLIDCLPSIGYLSLAALAAADYALIPITPAPYALMGLHDLFVTIRRTRDLLNPRLQVLCVVLNLVDGRSLRLEQKVESVLRQDYGSLIFVSKLSKRVGFAESPSFNQGIAEYCPAGASAREFDSFAAELLGRIGEQIDLRLLPVPQAVPAKGDRVSGGGGIGCADGHTRRSANGGSRPQRADSDVMNHESDRLISGDRYGGGPIPDPRGERGPRGRPNSKNLDLIFARSLYRNHSVPKGVY